jgi:multidrug efflux pump subunit AcrA (membrane-fusion protein)|tara:strand:+ start:887 stop:1714 length:828 start_codon:yes stop_codon:yes gene_type:complete
LNFFDRKTILIKENFGGYVKKIYLVITIIGLIIILGLLSFFYQKKNTQYLKVKKGDVQEAIYGLGKVRSRSTFDVKIGIMTNISKLYVKEGEKVKKNQKLISFSGASLFRAPFEGTITNIELKEGEVALPQISIMRLEDLEDKYIEVSLEQDAALRVRTGQTAKVIFESLKSIELKGKVQSLFPKKGEFIAHIEVKDIPENIMSGMTADIVVEVGKKKDVILIPLKAISEGRVVRMRADKKAVIDVEIGYTDGVWAELVSGDITLDDELVIKGKK